MFKNYKDNLSLEMAFSQLEDVVFDLRHGTSTWNDYHRQIQFIKLHLDCISGDCVEFNWQWLFDNNELCETDFIWFEEELSELGLTLEKYKKE